MKHFSEKGRRAVGIWKFTLENPDGTKEVKIYKNVIPDVFYEMLTNNMTDPTPTNAMEILHAALGDDDTAVDPSDIILGNEVYRNAIASKTNAANIAYATAFFSQAEVDGTFKEAGIFSDSTGVADSGILVSHVNIDVTKTNTQKLTIDWTLTFENA